MSLPTWVAFVGTDVDVDSAAKEGTVLRRARDNIEATRFIFVPCAFEEKTTTNTSFEDMDAGDSGREAAEVNVPLPDIGASTGVVRRIILRIRARDTNSDGEMRLIDIGSGNVGPAVAVDTPVNGNFEIELTVPIGWRDTLREIRIQGRSISSGTMSASRFYSIAGRLEY